jgi:hypothetical protein
MMVKDGKGDEKIAKKLDLVSIGALSLHNGSITADVIMAVREGKPRSQERAIAVWKLSRPDRNTIPL